MAQLLPDAGTILSKVTTDEAEVKRLASYHEIYYSLYCLVLPDSDRNLAVWTIAKVILYFAR